MAVLGETDISLAAKLGVSRQTVHSRRTGRTSMTADDLADMARALGVEAALLMGPPHEAVRWLVDNRADELDDVLSSNSAQSRCTHDVDARLNRSLSGAKLLVRCSPSGVRAAA